MSGIEPISRIRAVLVGTTSTRARRSAAPGLRQRCRPRALSAQAVLRRAQRGHPRRRQSTRDEGGDPASAARHDRPREPGDVLVFYYSGHGSQGATNGDQLTDGLDDAICPYDMDGIAGPRSSMTNSTRSSRTLPPEVLLEALFACCSGGADARGLEPEPRPASLRRDVRHLRRLFHIAARAEGDDCVGFHQLRATRAFTERTLRGAPRRRASPPPRTTWTAGRTGSSPDGAAGSSPSTSSRWPA